MPVSALTQATRLRMQLSGLLTALDIDLLGRETNKTVHKLKQLSDDARLDVRDWEMADSRTEMDKHSRAGLKRLEQLRTEILKASEHGIFSSLDVIDMSAQIDGIEAQLKQ